MPNRHSPRDNPVYDKPLPAITILKEALGIRSSGARKALRALAKAGYFVAPRLPTNGMLDAYLNAYGTPPRTPRSAIIGIGKARIRWAAMGEKGMAMALSTKRCEPSPCPPCEDCGSEMVQTHFDVWECGQACPGSRCEVDLDQIIDDCWREEDQDTP